MLVNAARNRTTSTDDGGPSPAQAAAGLPLYDGSPTGMASAGINLSPLTVQQNVPNIGDTQTAPKTRVNPTLEQGLGRSPGWRMGWMRKNIPFAPYASLSHRQRNFGPLRTEYSRVSGAHAPGQGPGQTVALHTHKHRPTVLADPETVYYTAAMPPTPTWGEPV